MADDSKHYTEEDDLPLVPAAPDNNNTVITRRTSADKVKVDAHPQKVKDYYLTAIAINSKREQHNAANAVAAALNSPFSAQQRNKNAVALALQVQADEEHSLRRSMYFPNPPPIVYFSVFVASFSELLIGYDIGVASGAIISIGQQFGLDAIQQEFVVGTLNIGTAIGPLLNGYIADSRGRRFAFSVLTCCLFMGSLCVFLSQSWLMILIGRFTMGLGVGGALLISPLYCAEITPSHMRGKLVSTSEFAINIGLLLGYVSNLAFHNVNEGWRAMFALGIIPPFLVLIGICFMLESPRWLISDGRETEAEEVLLEMYRYDDNRVDVAMRNIRVALKLEGQNSWSDICAPTKEFRVMLLVGFGVAALQHVTGSEGAVLYAPQVFLQAGLQSGNVSIMNVVLGLFKLCFITIAYFCMDKIGRRPLLMLSALFMGITFLLLSALYKFTDLSAWVVVFGFCIYVGSFSIGWGPITWVVTSEIFPPKMRGRVFGVATTINRAVSSLCALSFLSLIQWSLSGTLLLYGVLNLCCVIFCFWIPETKGKSLEEILALFRIYSTADAKEDENQPEIW